MDSKKDPSELFEIFQNELDLEEEQKADDDPDEKEDEPESGSQSDEAGSSEQKEASRDDRTTQESTEESASRDADPASASGTAGETADRTPEAASRMDEFDRSGTLEGNVVLSRGMSVFLLLVFIVAVIGAYFAGYNLGRQESEPVAVTTDDQPSREQSSANTPSDSAAETPETPDSSPAKNTSSAANETSKDVPANTETWYTIAVIAFDPGKHSRQELEQLIKKHVGTIRDRDISPVSTMKNLNGKGQYWIVVGRYKTRKSASKNADALSNMLARTEFSTSYRTDILDITRAQARSIK